MFLYQEPTSLKLLPSCVGYFYMMSTLLEIVWWNLITTDWLEMVLSPMHCHHQHFCQNTMSSATMMMRDLLQETSWVMTQLDTGGMMNTEKMEQHSLHCTPDTNLKDAKKQMTWAQIAADWQQILQDLIITNSNLLHLPFMMGISEVSWKGILTKSALKEQVMPWCYKNIWNQF